MDGPSQPFNTRHQPPPINNLRPYRPVVHNKQSKIRFERNRWGELLRHLGRDPSFPEKLLISRIISVEWWLLRTEGRLDRGEELTGHDIRGRLAAENRLRLDLVALGLNPRSELPMTALEYSRLVDRKAPASGAAARPLRHPAERSGYQALAPAPDNGHPVR